jgi:hypothetical protein
LSHIPAEILRPIRSVVASVSDSASAGSGATLLFTVVCSSDRYLASTAPCVSFPRFFILHLLSEMSALIFPIHRVRPPRLSWRYVWSLCFFAAPHILFLSRPHDQHSTQKTISTTAITTIRLHDDPKWCMFVSPSIRPRFYLLTLLLSIAF